MKLAKYIVKYFDPEIGKWMDGSPPLCYTWAAVARNHYNKTFETMLVWAESR